MKEKIFGTLAVLLTSGTMMAQDYSKVRVYSFNDRVEIGVESCILDASTNRATIVYFLKNNTRKSYIMQWIGSTDQNMQSYCGDKATRFIDDRGTDCYIHSHVLGGKRNTNLNGSMHVVEVVLPSGILVKGELVISRIDPEARSLQMVNLCVCGRPFSIDMDALRATIGRFVVISIIAYPELRFV
jgi:hypothetical protein